VRFSGISFLFYVDRNAQVLFHPICQWHRNCYYSDMQDSPHLPPLDPDPQDPYPPIPPDPEDPIESPDPDPDVIGTPTLDPQWET
jgi:hypothetical protein